MRTVFVLLTLVISVTSQDFPNNYPSSCNELYERYDPLQLPDGVYQLWVGSEVVSVYCHFNLHDGCGGGGWTTVMKIDGSKETFIYDSNFWSNMIAYNREGGQTEFDQSETKLPTYWSTPFTKICLAMERDQDFRFVVINRQASSLYSLIADGQHRATTLGRNTWKSLIGPDASLQKYCSKEGFNVQPDGNKQFVHSQARIGIIGNNENDCESPDSRIGFGTGGKHDPSNSCGNEATWGSDEGDVHIKAMGYIFVQ